MHICGLARGLRFGVTWVVAPFTWLVWLLLLSGCASSPDVTVTTKPTRGEDACTFSIVNRGGQPSVFYEKARIVGEVGGRDAETSEWWLHFPGDPLIDADGKVRAVNWPKHLTLRKGEVRIVGVSVCRCPPHFFE
jgi:hypothetical protein